MGDSNPVVPTTFSMGFEGIDGTLLSSLLSSLATAARELADAARTLKTQGSAAPPAPPSLSPPIGQAVNDFLLSKARGGRSDRYLRQLRVSLGSLVRDRSRVPVDAIDAGVLDSWSRVNRWSPRTRRGYLLDASVFFSWCLRRGWVRVNPVAGVDLPLQEDQAPGIHTPEQVRQVLAYARARDLGACRMMAIRYFAGVRSAEALRLREEDLAGEYVRIEASKSKTRRRRLIRIQPALRAWLDLGGSLPVSEKRIRKVVSGAGVPWPPNATRHSFCTYHLAAFQSAGATALDAGHSEAMLFRHYREVVTPELAAEFWSIRPDPAG